MSDNENESERWFRMSARIKRDKFNLTNTTPVSKKKKNNVNMSLLTSIFPKPNVNELTLFTNMSPRFC